MDISEEMELGPLQSWKPPKLEDVIFSTITINDKAGGDILNTLYFLL